MERPIPNILRSLMTYVCSVVRALLGGVSSQSSEISWAADTIVVSLRHRTARTWRGLAAVMPISRPSCEMERGPRTLTSISYPSCEQTDGPDDCNRECLRPDGIEIGRVYLLKPEIPGLSARSRKYDQPER